MPSTMNRGSKLPDPIRIFEPGKPCPDATRRLRELLKGNLDRKLVVISIAGRYRQGKSFLMNFIIRYLRAKGAEKWMEDHSALEGFAWVHRQDPVTRGVLVWPEIFKLRDARGEEVVVLLVDTQGVFDLGTSVNECTSIFALSVLLSSIQIFNIKGNFHGDDISNLQLFAEYGRLVAANSQSSQKPFQDLIFLVRDWAYPSNKPYGKEGGSRRLEEVLANGSSKNEHVSQRDSIKSCFESMRCFLMPHPGETVDTSDKFRGELSDMKTEFKDHLKAFVEDIFRPENLKTKKINGKDITGRDLVLSVGSYAEVLSSGDLPEAESLFEATVRAANSAVIIRCMVMYRERIQKLYTDPKDPTGFETFHASVVEAVILEFDKSVKMGGDRAIEAALHELQKQIAESKENSQLINQATWAQKRAQEQWEEAKQERDRLGKLVEDLGDSTGKLTQALAEAEKKQNELAMELEKKKESVEDIKTRGFGSVLREAVHSGADMVLKPTAWVLDRADDLLFGWSWMPFRKNK